MDFEQMSPVTLTRRISLGIFGIKKKRAVRRLRKKRCPFFSFISRQINPPLAIRSLLVNRTILLVNSALRAVIGGRFLKKY